MTEKTETEPQVYVACLGCYNEGRMHGKWMDADELSDRWGEPPVWAGGNGLANCERKHNEEWAIHDYDGVPNLGENPDTPYLIKVMRAIEEHGDPFREWFNLDPHNKSHHDDLSEAFQEAYIGKWDRPEDFAEQLADDLGYLPCANAKNPNPLLAYVDFEWWWKSALRFDYDFSNGYVFRRDV